jgi:hypothetical protein
MPHRRHTITVATSTLFFVCLVLHAQTNLYSQTFLAYNNPEAYKVYESLLPADWTVTAAHARRLLVQAQTGSPDFCLKPDSESAALLQPVFNSFVALSKTTWLLQPNFRLRTSYELASREDLQAFFKPGGGGGWKGLAERYSDSASSYIVLSPVAFNADKTIAVVYMGHSCGSLCGGGTFYVLEKKDSIWRNMRWRGTSCAWAS